MATSRASGVQKVPAKVLTDVRVTKDLEELRRTVQDELAKTMQARESLENSRKARFFLARSGNAAQGFMSDLSKFLDAYSGICGVAKAADAKFGGVVTESLSLLLIVSIARRQAY
jgi:tetrahydromethanopterin S-methyltransferase subunit E